MINSEKIKLEVEKRFYHEEPKDGDEDVIEEVTNLTIDEYNKFLLEVLEKLKNKIKRKCYCQQSKLRNKQCIYCRVWLDIEEVFG